MAQESLVCKALFITKASRSQTHHTRRTSLEEWSARGRPLADNTQHSQGTDIHVPGGIRSRIPSKRAAVNPCLRPRGHWDRLSQMIYRCHRRNGPNFGRVFLMLNYTDITQNIYIQSWTVTEIMAREVWNFDSCYTLTDCQIHIETGRNMWFL